MKHYISLINYKNVCAVNNLRRHDSERRRPAQHTKVNSKIYAEQNCCRFAVASRIHPWLKAALLQIHTTGKQQLHKMLLKNIVEKWWNKNFWLYSWSVLKFISCIYQMSYWKVFQNWKNFIDTCLHQYFLLRSSFISTNYKFKIHKMGIWIDS